MNHWWGDFPLDTTLWIIVVFIGLWVLSHYVGNWWDRRKK